MKRVSKPTPTPAQADIDPELLEPSAQNNGVSFTVVNQNQALRCFVTQEALEFLDGGLHVNLRLLGVYELHQKQIDAVALRLVNRGVRPPELIVTLDSLRPPASD